MKFGKLLAAGKSWAGGNGSGRYQMRDGLVLPKFISPRNPFLREAAPEPAAPPPVVAAPAAIVEPAVADVVPPAEKISLTMRVGNGLKTVALFCLDHNPFSAIGKPNLPRMPRFGKSAVQGELSLDKVRVVRSDLTHADLEVVSLGGGQK